MLLNDAVIYISIIFTLLLLIISLIISKKYKYGIVISTILILLAIIFILFVNYSVKIPEETKSWPTLQQGYKSLYPELDTGDIFILSPSIFLKKKYNIPGIVGMCHVGIIRRTRDNKLELIHSSVNSYSSPKRSGIVIEPLSSVLDCFKTKIYRDVVFAGFRKLSGLKRDKKFRDNFDEIIERYKKYDFSWNVVSFFGGILKKLVVKYESISKYKNNLSKKGMVCVELVANIYHEMGLIDVENETSFLENSYFYADSDNLSSSSIFFNGLSLKNGAKLSSTIKYRFD